MKRRNNKRHARELLRAYGPPERRAWMTARPCLIAELMLFPQARSCWPVNVSQQCHIEIAGMGMKAPAHKIVPLCYAHHVELARSRRAFESRYGVNLDSEAERIEREYQNRQVLPW